MTTAREGEASYGGGAGGKFRKKPFRRPHTTPYDRPPIIIRNPRSEGWLSKLVDPASEFISSRAFKFFSNFRKRITEAEQEHRDVHEEAVPNNFSGAPDRDIDCNGNLSNSSDVNGISELEQMLKEKTFTRSEIFHLTELLRSRIVEFPVGDEERNNGGSHLKPGSYIERHEGFTRSPFQENRNRKFHNIFSTHAVSSRVLEEDVAASPAEVAKAYMVSRPPKLSPSTLTLHTRAPMEETPSIHPVSSALASKSLLHVGPPKNGFSTPRSCGRSALYTMATPYSRVCQTSNQKVSGSIKYDNGEPSSLSSLSGRVHDGQYGSKRMALKRRSSVLDDDTGSIGAIRRIRQKANLSFSRAPLLLDGAKYNVSKKIKENGEDSTSNTTIYSHVPSQSAQMAIKILQHLEKITQKEKSPESKLVPARDRSPVKLTPDMLKGQAHRSVEDVNFTKYLQEQDGHKFLEDSGCVRFHDAHDSSSQKTNKVEENGPKEPEIPLKVSAEEPNAGSVIAKSAEQPSSEKRAFTMNAHEDFLDLDDEIHINGPVSAPSGEGRDLQTSGKAISSDAEIVRNNNAPALPEVKISMGPASKNVIDPENYGSLATDKEKTGLNISAASLAPSSTFQQDVPSKSTSLTSTLLPPRDPCINTQKEEKMKGTSDISPPAAAAALKPSGSLSSVASIKNSNLSNPPLGLSPFSFSSAAPTVDSCNFTNQISSTASGMTSTGTTTTTDITATLDRGPSISAPPSLFPATPTPTSTFNFTSLPQSSPAPTLLTTASTESTAINKPKADQETTFGNLTNPSFGGTSLASSTSNNQSQFSFPDFGSAPVFSSQVSPVTQSMPFQFGVSGSSPAIGTSGTTFAFGATRSQSPSTGFPFKASSMPVVAPTNNSSTVSAFSSGTLSSVLSSTASSGTTSSFSNLPQSQALFGSTTAFGGPGNMENSMAMDTVHASTPSGPVFGQPSVLPTPAGIAFGATDQPLSSLPFQFGAQQNPATSVNMPPFQSSNDIFSGGSFSMGSGGDGKRKMVRVSKANKNRSARKIQ